MSRASRCVVVLAGLASMVLSGASAAGERAYVTWAVVPCGKAAAPGLADLVSVELQRIGGVELVERQQLKLVTDELSLQAMLGAKDAASRARACKLLEADALVLLQEGDSGDRKHVKLLISESRYGARLRVSHIPYAVGTLETLVALIAGEVRDVLAKFPKGIERMVAVPAFVSRDLVHRYDRLQDGFAYIIQMAFASLPGTAVIEVEEAHHIRRERALSAEGPAKAPVPLVVYGEYQVAGAIVAETPRVNLWLSVRDAKSVLQSIEKEGLTLEEAAGFLRTDAVPLIVRAAPLGARPLLSSEELFTALNARADTFSKLGAWEQAFGLREAAVLVEPEDTEHRCLLVREYCRVIRSAFPKDIRCRRGEEPFESLCRKRVDKWLLCLEHLEYVIRSGQITRRPALEHTALVLRSVNPMMTRYSIHMAGAERAKREFLTAVYPLILNLPSTPTVRYGLAKASETPENRYRGAAVRELNQWTQLLVRTSLTRYDRENFTKQDLDFLFQLLDELAPDKPCPSLAFADFLVRQTQSRSPGLSEAEFQEFLRRLEGSSRKLNGIYARYAVLHADVAYKRSVSDGMVARADDLLREYRALDLPRHPPTSSGWKYFEERLTSLRRRAVALAKGKRSTWPKGGGGGSKLARETGRLTFVPVALKVRTKAGETLAPSKYHPWGLRVVPNLVRCTDSLDVMWGDLSVLFLRQDGLLEEAVGWMPPYAANAAPTPRIQDVAWDGRHVWAATSTKGILVFDTAGKHVGTVDQADGLPPNDRGLLLHPIEPGRVLAVGSFGERLRAWCAVVRWKGGADRVKVFHQATRVPAVDETSTEASRHASTAFIPTFLHEFQANKQGGDRIVLVGRAHRRSSGRSAGSLVGTYQLTNVSRPIGVDLKTLRVCVFNVWLSAPKRQHDSFLSRNGKLIAASGLSVYDQVPIVSPETEAAKTFVRSRRICVNKDGVHFLAWQAAPVCLFHNGFVYAPAQAWFRFDPDTLAEERLVPGALPKPYIELKHHGVSCHYGLVAWGDKPDSFYQVEVE